MRTLTLQNDPKWSPAILSQSDLSPDLLAAIDHAAALATDKPERSEMIARILTEWLHAKGHLRHFGADEGTRPENLTSENDD